MDWTIKPYAEANHPPVAKLAHAPELRARPGDRVVLSAQGSTDPDGDALTYEWFYYPEPGTFTKLSGGGPESAVSIQNAREAQATLAVPTNYYRAGTMHIIVAVTDGGVPALTRYRRVVVTVP